VIKSERSFRCENTSVLGAHTYRASARTIRCSVDSSRFVPSLCTTACSNNVLQERMQAIVGPWATFARELQNQIRLPSPSGFADELKWSSERGRDFQCICSVLSLCESWPDQGKVDSLNLEKLLERRTDPPLKFRNDVIDSFQIFATLVADKQYNAGFRGRISPVEFTMTAVLIYVHRTKLSLIQLASAIDKMRKDVSSKHEKQVRQNQNIVKHMSGFIKKVQAIDLRSDGQGDTPAAKRGGKKRKRQTEDSDDTDNCLSPALKDMVTTGSPKVISKARKSDLGSSAISDKSSHKVSLTNSKSKKTEKPTPTATSKPKPGKLQTAIRTGGQPMKSSSSSSSSVVSPPLPAAPPSPSSTDEPMDISPVRETPPTTLPPSLASPDPVPSKQSAMTDLFGTDDQSRGNSPMERPMLPPSLSRLTLEARVAASPKPDSSIVPQVGSSAGTPEATWNAPTIPRPYPSRPVSEIPRNVSAPPIAVKQESPEADMQMRLNGILAGAGLWNHSMQTAHDRSQGTWPPHVCYCAFTS
jgi:hypothetical protein